MWKCIWPASQMCTYAVMKLLVAIMWTLAELLLAEFASMKFWVLGFSSKGRCTALGDKGKSFPEEWCHVLIKFIIEIGCNCRNVWGQGIFLQNKKLFGIFFCVTSRGVSLVAAASRILELWVKVQVCFSFVCFPSCSLRVPNSSCSLNAVSYWMKEGS